MLLFLNKYYKGIEWFDDKPLFLLNNCLNNAIKREQVIPKIIQKIAQKLNGEPDFGDEPEEMRSAEDIMKDFGLIYEKGKVRKER